ncbi:hypothetical protein [Sorangium sp. So ce124]|uniref:hypothetical protein n=1 Tax=Sorangium sp. So ce124 TaxID=3133280 RepID=UPI003F6293C0
MGTDSASSGRGSRGARGLSPIALLLVLVPTSCTKTTDDAQADTGTHAGEHALCGTPYDPDPRDATMTGEPIRITTNEGDPDDPSDDQYDLQLPQEMVDWLEEQNWVQEHGDWHNIRRWDLGCLQSPSGGGVCEGAEVMEARGLWRAEIQEGEPGDGYAFLVMHRHMIRGFKEAFPKHAALISGFKEVPLTQDDPENPLPWVDIRWSEDQLAAIALLQDIENNLDLFESEDDFGKWIQLGDGGFPPGGPGGFPPGGPPGFGGGPGGSDDGTGGSGGAGGSDGTSGGGGGTGGSGGGTDDSGRPPGSIHGGLHSQWAVPGSPYNLVNNDVNVVLVSFWRLHGWIDDMWERYRVAKGIGEDDASYKAEMIAQCDEMHALGHAAPPSSGPTTTETGVFAERVAPILNAYCTGCHGAVAASQGLVLSDVAPSKVREALVGVTATEVELPLVDPGSPSTSWLFRKLTGDFSDIECTECGTAMPPAGVKPTDEEIQTIRAWIEAGATAE